MRRSATVVTMFLAFWGTLRSASAQDHAEVNAEPEELQTETDQEEASDSSESDEYARGFFTTLEQTFAARLDGDRFAPVEVTQVRVGDEARRYLTLFGQAGFLHELRRRSTTLALFAGAGLRLHSAGPVRFLAGLHFNAGVARLDDSSSYPFIAPLIEVGLSVPASSWIDLELMARVGFHFQIATGEPSFDYLEQLGGSLAAAFYLDRRENQRGLRRAHDYEAHYAPTDMPARLRLMRNIAIGFGTVTLLSSTAVPLLIAGRSDDFDAGPFALFVTATTLAGTAGFSAYYMGLSVAGAYRAREHLADLSDGELRVRSRRVMLWGVGWMSLGTLCEVIGPFMINEIAFLSLIWGGLAVFGIGISTLAFGHGMRMMLNARRRGWTPAPAGVAFRW